MVAMLVVHVTIGNCSSRFRTGIVDLYKCSTVLSVGRRHVYQVTRSALCAIRTCSDVVLS